MSVFSLTNEMLGWVAAGLTLATFSCVNIVRLRYCALCANAAFIGYGVVQEIWPVLALHAILVPINLWRLVQTKVAQIEAKLKREVVARRREEQASLTLLQAGEASGPDSSPVASPASTNLPAWRVVV